jgi:molybdopterin synthase catalytic subunit
MSWRCCRLSQEADVLARITDEPILPATLLAETAGEDCGAVLLFLGTVRELNDGRPVRGMRYDAYVEMAEAVLASIVREAAARFAAERIAAVHRIGELGIGDVSVAIAVATPHRAEAYEASRYVIEEIKARLPVWKREHYVADDARWLAGRVPDVKPTRHDG